MLISQPLSGFVSQSVQPTLQTWIPHAPDEQVPVAFAGAQAAPQTPQSVVVLRFVSQPVEYLPSQSANPAVQLVMLHVPFEQLAAPLAAPHEFPHAPQLLLSVLRFVSQPSEYVELQSAKPAWHCAILHAPLWHVGVPFVTLHEFVHDPQCWTSLAVWISQPLPG